MKHVGALSGHTFTIPEQTDSPVRSVWTDLADSFPPLGRVPVVPVSGNVVLTDDHAYRMLVFTGAGTLALNDTVPVGGQVGIVATTGPVQVFGEGGLTAAPAAALAIAAHRMTVAVRVTPVLWLVAYDAQVSGGSAPAPANPTLTFVQADQVRITNYNAALNYELLTTSGTASRSGDLITFTATDGTLYVRANQNGGDWAGPASFTRRPYTYNRSEWVETRYYEHDGGSHGNGPTCGSTWSCTYWPTQNRSGHHEGVTTCGLKDYTPSGWADSGTDWWKVINP